MVFKAVDKRKKENSVHDLRTLTPLIFQCFDCYVILFIDMRALTSLSFIAVSSLWETDRRIAGWFSR
ncbi:hypothetical protein DPMN_093871 [Dreissena polymorpha]|uniref:Uncharacterized protein n=1 Tax=Dreissena polymorpha TaxID=45954 RepID=A0A9D4L4D1_DREPO|nr:hypothetical protein DPMN_093871 [Dreissena polymorpha]